MPSTTRRALRNPEVRNVEAAVTRAGRNDHRRGLHAPAIAQVSAVAFQTYRGASLRWDRHPGAELLRLDVGAARERLARDARWETEIILDRALAPACPPNAARRIRSPRDLPTRHKRRSRGRRVPRRRSRHRRCDPARRSAPCRVRALTRLARIFQIPFGTPQRQIRRVAGVMFDELRRIAILCGVEQLVRIRIARQEALQTNHVRLDSGPISPDHPARFRSGRRDAGSVPALCRSPSSGSSIIRARNFRAR